MIDKYLYGLKWKKISLVRCILGAFSRQTPPLGGITWSCNVWPKNTPWSWTESLTVSYVITFRPRQLMVESVLSIFQQNGNKDSFILAQCLYKHSHCRRYTTWVLAFCSPLPFFTQGGWTIFIWHQALTA